MEVYLGAFVKSIMELELFAKTINGQKPLIILAKSSIVAVWKDLK